MSGLTAPNGSSTLRVPTQPPTVSALTFDVSSPNGTHYFLSILGANLGPAVTDPCAGAAVTVDGARCEALLVRVPDTELLCVTPAAAGQLVVATAAGVASVAYDSAVVRQPPLVLGVAPWVWSTTENTTITLTGERCVAAQRCLGVGWVPPPPPPPSPSPHPGWCADVGTGV